jgi:hypothetical protein
LIGALLEPFDELPCLLNQGFFLLRQLGPLDAHLIQLGEDLIESGTRRDRGWRRDAGYASARQRIPRETGTGESGTGEPSRTRLSQGAADQGENDRRREQCTHKCLLMASRQLTPDARFGSTGLPLDRNRERAEPGAQDLIELGDQDGLGVLPRLDGSRRVVAHRGQFGRLAAVIVEPEPGAQETDGAVTTVAPSVAVALKTRRQVRHAHPFADMG